MAPLRVQFYLETPLGRHGPFEREEQAVVRADELAVQAVREGHADARPRVVSSAGAAVELSPFGDQLRAAHLATIPVATDGLTRLEREKVSFLVDACEAFEAQVTAPHAALIDGARLRDPVARELYLRTMRRVALAVLARGGAGDLAEDLRRHWAPGATYEPEPPAAARRAAPADVRGQPPPRRRRSAP